MKRTVRIWWIVAGTFALILTGVLGQLYFSFRQQMDRLEVTTEGSARSTAVFISQWIGPQAQNGAWQPVQLWLSGYTLSDIDFHFQVLLPDGSLVVDNQAPAQGKVDLPLAQQALGTASVQAGRLAPQVYQVAAPILGSDGKPFAVLVDRVDWTARYQQSQATLLEQMGVSSTLLLLGMALALVLIARSIVGPMARLKTVAEGAARGAAGARAPAFQVSEFNRTGSAINSMLDQLEEQRRTLDLLNRQLEARNQELLLLNHISDIALAAKSTPEGIQNIAAEISAVTGFPVVTIEQYDPASQTMTLWAAAGAGLPASRQTPVARSLSGRAAASAKMLVEHPDDAGLSPPLPFAWRTYLGIPMTGSQGVLGVISLFHPQDIEIDEGLAAWMAALASHIAALHERLYAEAVLARSEERFDLALESTGLGVWDWDVATGKVLTNPRWAIMLGYDPSEIQPDTTTESAVFGVAWTGLIHPQDFPILKAAVEEHLAGRSPLLNVEMRLKTKSGSWKWVLNRGQAVRLDGSGRALRMVGTQCDIDDRKASEEELRRRDTILETVNFAAERFLSSKSWQESLPEVLIRLAESNRASRAQVFEVIQDIDGAWLSHPHSEWTAPGFSARLEKADPGVLSFRASGFGRWEEELSRGRPICGPVRLFPPAERGALTLLNVLSLAVIPVFVGSRWWGFIELDDCESERAWPSDEVDALKVAAGILGAAIQRQQTEEMVKRLYETERDQRQIAQVLREVGATFSASLSFDGILDQILDELPRIVPYDAAFLLLVSPAPTDEPARRTQIEKSPGLERKAVVARQRGYEDYAPQIQKLPGLAFDLSKTPALRWMADKLQPLVVSDTRVAPGLVHLVEKEHFGSWAAAPVLMQGQVVVFFVLEKVEPGFFRSEQAELLGLFANQAGLALQNAQLFAGTLGALEREQNLSQVTHAISSALELPTILQNVVRLATSLCGADAGTLAILSPDGSTLSYPYLFNLPVALAAIQDPPGQGLAWHVITERKSQLLPEYSLYPNACASYVEAGVHAAIFVPLIAGDVCLGCLGLFSYHPEKRFSRRDLASMESVGRQAGIAIQNARLFEAAERRAHESETLRLAVSEVTSAMEFDKVLDKILNYLHNVVPYDSSVVFLNEGDHLRAEAGRGLVEGNQVIGHIFPADNPLFLEIKRIGSRPLILADAQADPRFARWGNDTHIRGWMGLPLRVHGEPIGYLTMDSSRVGAYGPQDAALVQAFADEVAIAIENARLFQQVQHLAITDPLTGLHNRRYFFEASRREFERARRYQHPLALLMLDIDHFKMVNDTCGHLAGDHVLVTLAARCMENLRTVDISARYGGEEFVFLLPETGIERATQVANRLRTAIMETPIDTGEKQISISVSLGLAELDEDCIDLQALVARSDMALYGAKETGRGRVTVWVKEMGIAGA
jgi:diguanylate cyclase (GGDEF)-like protein/PAS domain S-box-containing protein